MARFLPIRRVLRRTIGTTLVNTLMVTKTINLPLLRITNHIHRLLQKPMLYQDRHIFRVLPIFRPTYNMLLLLFLTRISSFPGLPRDLPHDSSRGFSISELRDACYGYSYV